MVKLLCEMKNATFLIVLLMTAGCIEGQFGLCQTGCNAVAVVCYAAGGAIFGNGNKDFVPSKCT